MEGKRSRSIDHLSASERERTQQYLNNWSATRAALQPPPTKLTPRKESQMPTPADLWDELEETIHDLYYHFEGNDEHIKAITDDPDEMEIDGIEEYIENQRDFYTTIEDFENLEKVIKKIKKHLDR